MFTGEVGAEFVGVEDGDTLMSPLSLPCCIMYSYNKDSIII